MKFFHFFLLFLFISFHAQSNEQNNIRFIDLDYIFNNSDVGKKISKNAISSKKKIDEKNIKLEKNLEKQKNDILAKKNILEAKEFEKLVISHQKNVQEYQLDKGKSLKDLSTKNLEVTKNFMKKVDNILLQYASDNNIGIILNKNNLLKENTKGVVIVSIANQSPLANLLSINDIIIEVQKNPVKDSSDLNKLVDGIFKKGEKTLLLKIINNNNRKRYLGVKIN